MAKEHPFNKYLREHYWYNFNEEEEIRTQVYKNKNTNDFISMVTILKAARFKTKSELSLFVVKSNIFLMLNVLYYDETVTPKEAEQLEEDLEKQLTNSNIMVDVLRVSKDYYNIKRVKEL